jgi:hypothetical protein
MWNNIWKAWNEFRKKLLVLIFLLIDDMKKWMLFLGAIVLLICSYFLFFFPFAVSRTVSGRATLSAANRCFHDTSRWADWWPKSSGITYRIMGVSYSEVRVFVGLADGTQVPGAFRIAPLNMDSIIFQWECRLPGYSRREDLGRRMEAVVDSFRTFVQDTKNVYGVNFHRAMSHDTTLIAIESRFAVYPGTDEVYRRIDSLKAYLAGQGAEATGFPWLNVTKMADGTYKMTVALPTNRRLPGNSRIVPQRFVPWKMIEGDVYGGPHTVEKALRQMQLYKLDYVMTIVAMPYQYLLIDRRQQPDTTKWVTRVCAPIT